MTSFAERFKAARTAHGLSQRELARRIGITGSAISQWESGDTEPADIDALEKAADEMGTTTRYLRTGKIDRISEPRTPYLRALHVWGSAEDLPADQYVMLPRLEYFLSAGNGGPDPNTVEASEVGAAFRADFVAAEGWSPQTHFTMRATGESMEPTIQDGAPVVIATNEKAIRSGRVYAILIDGEPLLKRLDKLPGGAVRIRSDNTSNQAYAAFEVPESSIEIIGRAVWTPIKL